MKTFLFLLSLWMLGLTGYSQGYSFDVEGFDITHGVSQSGSPSPWEQPVGLLFSSSGSRMFVWEKAGKVFVCNRNAAGEYVKQNTPVIDISEEVDGHHDFGLTGFALDPEFEANGLIYLLYVADLYYILNHNKPGYNPAKTYKDTATIGRVTRYKTNIGSASTALTVLPGTRDILLGETLNTGIPILHLSHGTGTLLFATDGTLLVSCGDGANYDGADQGSDPISYYREALQLGIIRPDENNGVFRSQMLTSLSGKILRIDPSSGDGIGSNPYFEESAPGSTKSKIWAIGLRNPFRMAQLPDQGSRNPSEGHLGEIFIGDVGFGEWEELNILKDSRTNFGWPIYEGIRPGNTYDPNKNNPETPVPVEVRPGCNGRKFLKFGETIREDNIAKDSRIYYPCTPVQVYGSDKRFLHVPPVLDFRHFKEDVADRFPDARVPIFLTNGQASSARIGTPQSNVSLTGGLFNGNAITGVLPYSGTKDAYPPEFRNRVFISDYQQNWIKTVTLENMDKVTKVDAFASNIGPVVCMAENPIDGLIYFVYFGTSGPAIKKIMFGGNMPPVAKINANHTHSEHSTLPVHFDGTGSSDREDGNNLSYTWDFDDPASGSANISHDPTVHHTFNNPSHLPKKYTVTLTVEDQNEAISTAEYIISLDNTPPVVQITSPVDSSKYRIGGDTLYTLQANVTDLEQGPGELQYEWQTVLAHNSHFHPEPIDTNKVTASNIDRLGCTGGETYHWIVSLKVTDAAGLFAIDTARVFPACTATLPIFLHKFSVTQNGSSNQVKWSTELEAHIEYFELERSTDGINFLPVNRQEARNTTGTNHYSFEDKNFLPGTNYYRLKMMEVGNIVRYSVIIKTITTGEDIELKVVPNPVVHNFSLSYQSLQRDRVTIEVRDLSGKILHSLQEDVNKGANVIYMQNLPNWQAGVYFISVKGNDGVKQAKFIKVRE